MTTSEDINIRETDIGDLERIIEVETLAFGSDIEAKLVSKLLSDKSAEPIVSLLAFNADEAVGHIFFSRAYFDNAPNQPLIYILAPLAVKPTFQRKGIGGILIKKGLEILKEKNAELVFVLGHKKYYPKYGFIPDAGKLGFAAPYPIPNKDADAWMVQSLNPKGFENEHGKIRCADELNKPELWKE
ncbi:N-acetyltransferase [Maribacter sp. TH_r10]|uniref:GNAT family N-acetyltransferase n=1 Tax=Maribacter sp. TH_r10 TaxID=3082086 RepID=UPI0029533307|nr:N-acetyltransferase [Maribacter sp. TH_r10]MDV7137968.1 N-acetyltransferase [Maribacter sp. TH_r10]